MLVLSTCLVGNVFAGDFAGSGIFGFFDNVVNAIVSFARADDGCPTRQCQTCKPIDQGGNGDCRPTPN